MTGGNSFMKSEITFGVWAEIDTANGTWFVPAEVLGVIPRELGVVYEEQEDLEAVGLGGINFSDYTEGGEFVSVEFREGYGARLSAPGYLDCTDWTVFKTKEQAEAYIDQLASED
jgi:hypothetical protein